MTPWKNVCSLIDWWVVADCWWPMMSHKNQCYTKNLPLVARRLPQLPIVHMEMKNCKHMLTNPSAAAKPEVSDSRSAMQTRNQECLSSKWNRRLTADNKTFPKRPTFSLKVKILHPWFALQALCLVTATKPSRSRFSLCDQSHLVTGSNLQQQLATWLGNYSCFPCDQGLPSSQQVVSRLVWLRPN